MADAGELAGEGEALSYWDLVRRAQLADMVRF